MAKKVTKVLMAGAVGAGVCAVWASGRKKSEKKNKRKLNRLDEPEAEKNFDDRNAYFVGGGLASMAGAAYLVRDCGMEGGNIHIFEGLGVLGGSNDGSGDNGGFVCRGGRMLNEETYENFWELFSSIPSLEMEGRSVTEEILNFDHLHPTHAQARLIDRDGVIQDVRSMGFNQADRMALLKLLATPEHKLDGMTIEEWFRDTPHMFETNFWYMWQTTFAFQKWSSLFEFRRYMNRMIFEFSRIETLEGVTRTRYNQYESVILPLKTYLEKRGVHFHMDTAVTDLSFAEGEGIRVTSIRVRGRNGERVISLEEDDICIMTNGCMTDCAAVGDFKTPAPYRPEAPASGELWRRIASQKPGLGNPEPFFGNPEQTNWESFTVTCRGGRLLRRIENFSGNIPGSGALMTFKDSGWLMSIVVAAQPHFKAQRPDTTIFWGYALYTDRDGDYVKKPMRDCTGEEILTELIHQFHWEDCMGEIMADVVNVIPCMMPYVDAQFQPRNMSDRPAVVPEGSENFAMISQFVEIPEDMVFTEEYSVRAARMAVYTLMDVKDREICPVTPYRKDPRVLWKAFKKSYL